MSKKISLQEAMDQLKIMFPNFDEEVLKAMIFQTKGHFERTVEILLQIDSQNPKKQNNTSNIVNKIETKPTLKHNLPDDFLMYRPTSVNSQERTFQQPKKETTHSTQQHQQSQQNLQQTPVQQTTFEYLSEYAKQKFKEFQDKFGGNKTGDPQQYKSLLNTDLSDDEFENKKDK